MFTNDKRVNDMAKAIFDAMIQIINEKIGLISAKSGINKQDLYEAFYHRLSKWSQARLVDKDFELNDSGE